jgi:hypothetical protein
MPSRRQFHGHLLGPLKTEIEVDDGEYDDIGLPGKRKLTQIAGAAGTGWLETVRKPEGFPGHVV